MLAKKIEKNQNSTLQIVYPSMKTGDSVRILTTVPKFLPFFYTSVSEDSPSLRVREKWIGCPNFRRANSQVAHA
jgi:hypothetical protein